MNGYLDPIYQGINIAQQAVSPIANGVMNNPVSRFLFGGAENVAQDIGAGMGVNSAPGLNNSQNAATQMAQKAAEKATQIQDPEEKQRLLEVAKETYQTVNQGSRQTAKSFSPDVQQSPLIRAPVAAMQIGSGADLLSHPVSAVKGIVNVVRHPIKTAQGALDAAGSFLDDPIQALKDLPWDLDHSFKLQNDPNFLTSMGNRVLAGQFKNAGHVVPNPASTMGNLADYGFTSPDQIKEAADTVTGHSGILNQAVEEAVKSQGVVNTGDVLDPVTKEITRPGMIKTAEQSLDNTDFLSPIQKKNLMQKIVNSVANKATINGDINGGDPGQLLDTLRNWEAKAQGTLDIHGMVKPNIPPEEKEVAQFYNSMANDLKQRLFMDSGVNDLPVTDFLKSKDLEAIRGLSSKLADDVENAGSILNLRGLQANFVKGSKMVTAGANAGEAALNPAEAITGAVAATGNPVAMAATLAQTRPGMNVAGNALRSAGQLLQGSPLQGSVDVLGQTLGHTLSNGVAGSSVGNDQNNGPEGNSAYNNIHNNQSISQVNTNVNGVNQNLGSIKPNAQTGKYEVPNPFQAGVALSDQDYMTQKTALLQAQSQPENMYNPINKARIEAQMSDLENKYQVGKNLATPYQSTVKLNTLANDATQKIQSDPNIVNILSNVKSLDELKQKFSGQYKTLADELEILENQVPGLGKGSLFQPGMTAQAALSALDFANKNIINNFNATLQSYLSPSGGKPAVNAMAPQPINTTPQPILPSVQPISQGSINKPPQVDTSSYLQPL